ncbi:MAG: NCS2 family permease [Candidatus Omnitrophica bacterium]|nr:NCS2 family permease [Candidatus Omnitrophota bacterium]
MFEKIFKLKENGTDIKTEVLAGITTFMTMAYIICVQPVVLSKCGMDFGAVMTATCISSAIATLLMGIMANYPIALAPAMGHNFFFAFTVCLGMGIPWQTALGAVFISGALFIILSFVGIREHIVDAVPQSLKSGIAVGIGFLIAFVGLQWSGIVTKDPAIMVKLGDLKSGPVMLSIFGVTVITTFMLLKIRGAILLGIVGTTLLGLHLKILNFHGIAKIPPSIGPTFLQLDIVGAFNLGLLTVIFIFFFLDLFDTIGTLIGIAEEADLMKDGKLPRARQALLSDAIGTVGGAILGTSTVTSYIESSSGVAEGGRTGLANVVTSSLFLIALFFYPLIRTVGEGVTVNQSELHPVVAPALIVVGSLLFKGITKIKWGDVSESIPAFLTLVIMPLTFSITEGISFGFISYSFLKCISGRHREAHWIVHVFAILFVLRYIFL